MGRKRILVVDDDENVLFVLQHALARLGPEYDIILTGDGDAALRLAAEQPIDLFITDIRLPRMDGVALTRALRQGGRHEPVIWMTAYGGPDIAENASRLGVYRCLDKPIEVAAIRRISLEALSSGEG